MLVRVESVSGGAAPGPPGRWSAGPAVVAVLLLLAGCGSSGPSGQAGAPPAPREASGTPPAAREPAALPGDPAAEEQMVLAAYRCMWEAYDRAGRAPRADPGDGRLARCATGRALQALIDGLESMRQEERVVEGAVVLGPEVVELSGTGAQVRDCADSTGWLTVERRTGQVVGDPRGRQLIVADLLRVGGVWKVSLFGVREVGSCVG